MRSVSMIIALMMAAALVALSGCAERSTGPEAGEDGAIAASGDGFSNETVEEACEDDYTKVTVCPADEIGPDLE